MIPDVSNERFHQNGGTGGREVAPPAQVWILDVRGVSWICSKKARFAIYVHGAPGVATVCYWKVGARAVPPKGRNRWRGGRLSGPGLDFGCPGVSWICSKRTQICHIRTRCPRCSHGLLLEGGGTGGSTQRAEPVAGSPQGRISIPSGLHGYIQKTAYLSYGIKASRSHPRRKAPNTGGSICPLALPHIPLSPFGAGVLPPAGDRDPGVGARRQRPVPADLGRIHRS